MNESAIWEGRCKIIHGSVSDLPFEDSSFDVVTAFETVYFWPDFVNDLKEVRRVLKPEGIIFIANEALPKDDDYRQKYIVELLEMKIYSDQGLRQSLTKTCFSNFLSFVKDSKDSFTGDDAEWICLKASKF